MHKLHQKIKGCIKAVIIKREGKNWYALAQADQEPDPLPETGRSVIVRKELSDRVHECPYCGFVADRDYNSSRNILIAGMEQPWPGAKISTSRFREASFGDEVGSPTL